MPDRAGHGGHQRTASSAEGILWFQRLEAQPVCGMYAYGEGGARFYTKQKSIMQS
jgi:hypothetical protein